MWQNQKMKFNITLAGELTSFFFVLSYVSYAEHLSKNSPYAVELYIFWNRGSATLSIKIPAAYWRLLSVLLIAFFTQTFCSELSLKVKHTSRSCRLFVLEFFLFCFLGLSGISGASFLLWMNTNVLQFDWTERCLVYCNCCAFLTEMFFFFGWGGGGVIFLLFSIFLNFAAHYAAWLVLTREPSVPDFKSYWQFWGQLFVKSLQINAVLMQQDNLQLKKMVKKTPPFIEIHSWGGEISFENFFLI